MKSKSECGIIHTPPACVASAIKASISCCCCSAAASDEELCAYQQWRNFHTQETEFNQSVLRSCLDFSHFVLQLLHLSKIRELGTIHSQRLLETCVTDLSSTDCMVASWCFIAIPCLSVCVPTSNEDCCFKLSISC